MTVMDDQNPEVIIVNDNHEIDSSDNEDDHDVVDKAGYNPDIKLLDIEDVDEERVTKKIFSICQHGKKDKLEKLAKSYKKSKKFKKLLTTHDEHYNTPFHIAARYCHKPLLEYICKHWKIDINERGYNKMTALHYAARYGKKVRSKKMNFQALQRQKKMSYKKLDFDLSLLLIV